MTEWSNAHDTGDCLDSCQHPDHAYDEGKVDLDWLMRRLTMSSSEAFDLEIQRARREENRPVML